MLHWPCQNQKVELAKRKAPSFSVFNAPEHPDHCYPNFKR